MGKRVADFQTLVDGVRRFQSSDIQGAAERWLPLKTADDRLVRVFARALSANFGETDENNLYDAEAFTDSSRQIDLFAHLHKLKFIRQAQRVVVSAHVRRAQTGTTLLDLGPGNGHLTAQIVRASEGRIRKVIAVDIDPANVERSEQVLRETGVEFHGVVGRFEDIDFAELHTAEDGPIAVNAALALHHLTLTHKRDTLSALAKLKPSTFTLIEPNSDHWTADLLARFIHCFAHFQAVEYAIAESNIPEGSRGPMLEFFAREVMDIMRDAPNRFERHESWLFWYRELLRQNFTPVAIDVIDTDLVELLPGTANTHARGTHLVSAFTFTI